jgi:hypothetical protein
VATVELHELHQALTHAVAEGLGWLMYRSGLVPRGMALLGLVPVPSCSLEGPPRCSVSSSQTPSAPRESAN